MKKHLLFEGPVQEGKSTLIRKYISGFLPDIGGFSSQRLLDGSGKTVGFRIVPASESLELTAEYDAAMPGVFLYFGREGPMVNLNVLAYSISGYLEESGGKKLILLDEIGGAELLKPEARSALARALSGPVSCLGVWKLESSLREMCRNPVVSGDSIECHLQFRRGLTEGFDADIVYFERSCAAEAEKILNEFINMIFK